MSNRRRLAQIIALFWLVGIFSLELLHGFLHEHRAVTPDHHPVCAVCVLYHAPVSQPDTGSPQICLLPVLSAGEKILCPELHSPASRHLSCRAVPRAPPVLS